MAKVFDIFCKLVLFQLLLVLFLDFALCPPQCATSKRPLPCTNDTFEAYDQALVDSAHPTLDVTAQAAPSLTLSDDESQVDEEGKPEQENEAESRCELQSPRNTLTIVY